MGAPAGLDATTALILLFGRGHGALSGRTAAQAAAQGQPANVLELASAWADDRDGVELT